SLCLLVAFFLKIYMTKMGGNPSVIVIFNHLEPDLKFLIVVQSSVHFGHVEKKATSKHKLYHKREL
ncbi:MAG: hypothetical protein ACKPFA_11885, partial [Dolichospermum sp.]